MCARVLAAALPMALIVPPKKGRNTNAWPAIASLEFLIVFQVRRPPRCGVAHVQKTEISTAKPYPGAMRSPAYPTCLGVLADDELLSLAMEPECLRERTSLEIELLRRLAQAQHIVELAHAEQRRMLAELWALADGTAGARE